MGQPKAGVALAGRPLIAYPIEAARSAGLDPVVVAKRESELPPLECPVIRDTDARAHPAAGILAALRAGDGAPVVVLACDTPFVPAELLQLLAGVDAPTAVPMVGGRLQPLLARYGRSATPALQNAIERGEPLHEAIGALDPLVLGSEDLASFGDPDRILFNVNDANDLAAAERLMATAASG